MLPFNPLWRQIQKENFTSIPLLADFLELSDNLRDQLFQSPRFPLNLSRRLAAKIAKNTLDDPILRQFIPLQAEQLEAPGYITDPVRDQTFRKEKKLLQKYRGRALLVTTGACAMNCRFCFRQNFPYEKEEKGFEKELAHLRENDSLSEVILSGGDPLSLSDETLRILLQSLEQIPHLQRIRFHTRFPLGIPERIDPSFLSLLASSSKQIFFVIHCNHPRELDSDVWAALKKIQLLGIPILNQSVLLKGVNDQETTLSALLEALIDHGILPHYLHQLDPVAGASHFAVSDERGKELLAFLKESLPGFALPRFVREIPGYPSKTFITN